jgi:hypothetical protein
MMTLDAASGGKANLLRQASLEFVSRLRLSEADREHVLGSRLFVGTAFGATRTDVSAQIARADGESASVETPASLDERIARGHELGMMLDQLHRAEQQAESSARSANEGRSDSPRKRAGSYFTPPELTRRLIESSRKVLVRRGLGAQLVVLDPAVGGGAFLLEAGRLLLGMECLEAGMLERLWGIDRSELSLAVADTALRLAFGAEAGAPQLLHGDSLRDELPLPARIDWVLSNPPWVAYQGRASCPLPAEERAFYRRRFQAFRGYPTLQSVFVERSAELAATGVVTLLLPSSLADLDGYRNARRALTMRHRPDEPFEEYGQDAFQGVVQPCFGLIAEANSSVAIHEGGSEAPWRLTERGRKSDRGQELAPPACLGALLDLPKLPPATFGECGFQSNRVVTAELFSRGTPAQNVPGANWVPLLEGRNVHEFEVGEPRLWLDARPAELARAKVRLRAPTAYNGVHFVVRQTASYPIAAIHTGLPFRNSLLGGFETEGLEKELLVGLLNSTLYRALFLSMTRDARQAVFPQIKVAMLRSLPQPPESEARRREISALVRTWPGHDPNHGLGRAKARAELDHAVFELFRIDPQERSRVLAFFEARTQRSSQALGR